MMTVDKVKKCLIRKKKKLEPLIFLDIDCK